jgi:hypothetical protein
MQCKESVTQNFSLPKALKTVFQNVNKISVTPPPLECHVFFEWPQIIIASFLNAGTFDDMIGNID